MDDKDEDDGGGRRLQATTNPMMVTMAAVGMANSAPTSASAERVEASLARSWRSTETTRPASWMLAAARRSGCGRQRARFVPAHRVFDAAWLCCGRRGHPHANLRVIREGEDGQSRKHECRPGGARSAWRTEGGRPMCC